MDAVKRILLLIESSMNRSNLELFPCRIGRVSYLIRYVLLIITTVVASIMLELAPYAASAQRIGLSAGAVVLLIFIILCLFRSDRSPDFVKLPSRRGSAAKRVRSPAVSQVVF